MTSTMSVLGLYQWDATLFANLALPTGMTADDKNVLVDNLLMETAELEVIYTSAPFMKSAIGRWSAKELPTWNRIYAAAQAEYDPIENYNRYEESTETLDGTRQHSGNDTRKTITDDVTANNSNQTVTNTSNNTQTNSGTDMTMDTISESTNNSGTDNTTNKIAAFDSNVLVDHDYSSVNYGHNIAGNKSTTARTQYGHVITTAETDNGSVTETNTVNYDGDTTETFTHGEKIKDDSARDTESHIHGNIGVTTSQQMLESELMIAPKLNVFDYIIDSFKKRFCILVY